MVDEMLAAGQPEQGAPLCLIVPHAGYMYSGLVAASGFRQLENGHYDVAVIIASDHQHPLSAPISVWAEGGFETPLGIVPVDVDAAQALVAADARIAFAPATHEGEHPIEIQLPFLQRACPACTVVPILMGSDDTETVGVLADALVAGLSDRRAVIIASSDLSHYPPHEDALLVDGATLAAVETGDLERVRATVESLMAAGFPNLATCACGLGPILVAMRVAQGWGADTTTILRYATSGDIPQGDRDRVVGYGAVMFWRYEPPDLTQAQRETLLRLARTAIAAHLREEPVAYSAVEDPVLTSRSGVFVTLKQQGELRGCIGRTRADTPLLEVVPQTAIQAATSDPRFPPLSPDELADIELEISVLSPFQRLTDTSTVEVGTHGLLINKGDRSGILLPQVPVEQGWVRGEYLDNLCLKAGLPTACWQEGASLYTFTAVVFDDALGLVE
jgi:AmmeMemoRadiSam system protein B/AmmeMemoRadiSam system protein A